MFYAHDRACKIKLITNWETAQSSCLNCASNPRAVGPRKFWCEFLMIVLLLEQCPCSVFSVNWSPASWYKLFVPISYCFLRCQTLTCLSAISRNENTPCGPAPLWKLSYIVSLDPTWTKTDMPFCQVDPCGEVDECPVSCFSVILMAFLVWYVHCRADIHNFFVVIANNSLELWPATLNSHFITCTSFAVHKEKSLTFTCVCMLL